MQAASSAMVWFRQSSGISLSAKVSLKMKNRLKAQKKLYPKTQQQE